MMLLALAILQSANPVVMTREPHAASPWTQSVRARCGNAEIAIEGYGAGRPLDRAPRLRLNGRPVAGDAVERLLDDLAHRSAVYRVQVLCGQGGEITVRIDEGEKRAGGPVRYRSGGALIRGNRLVSYTGLEASDADSFWFR